MGGAGGLVLPAGVWRWRCEVWQGWQAVGAVQVGQGWRWCVVIVVGGLLLAWSSGAALAVLAFPGAGGRRCDLLRRGRPGAYRGRRWAAPRSGAWLLALALIRLHLIRLHGLRWRCSIRCVFVPPPEGSDSPLYRVVP